MSICSPQVKVHILVIYVPSDKLWCISTTRVGRSILVEFPDAGLDTGIHQTLIATSQAIGLRDLLFYGVPHAADLHSALLVMALLRLSLRFECTSQ
jgi:hypothetical protein